MQNDLVTAMRNQAGEHFRQGYNCAEAVFLAFRETVAPDIDASMVKMLTGFGGGVGHAGCMCGALSGSVAIMNLIKGRVNCSEDREACYQLVKEFHDVFEQHFGNTCCRVLNTHPFDTKEHLRNCIKITGNTGKLLAEYLIEKQLLSVQN